MCHMTCYEYYIFFLIAIEAHPIAPIASIAAIDVICLTRRTDLALANPRDSSFRLSREKNRCNETARSSDEILTATLSLLSRCAVHYDFRETMRLYGRFRRARP